MLGLGPLAATVAAVVLGFGNGVIAHEDLADGDGNQTSSGDRQQGAGFRDEEHASERQAVTGAEKARRADQGQGVRLVAVKGLGNRFAQKGAVASQ
jgi:hypothetical protein